MTNENSVQGMARSTVLPEVQPPVVVIDATAARSGGRVYLESLLGSLAATDCGFRFHVLYTSDLQVPERRSFPPNFTFELISFPAIAESSWMLGGLLRALWRLILLPGSLRRHRPAIFFSNSGSVPRGLPDGTAAVVAFHNAIPFQPDIWSLEHSRLRRWRFALLRRQAMQAMRRGAHAIAFSHEVKRLLIAAGAAPEKCSVIPHGIDWGEAERTSVTDTRPGSAPPSILYVSQIHRYKNLLNLLEALAVAREDFPALSLVVVGGLHDPGYAAAIEHTIESLGLRQHVSILSAIDRSLLPELYRRSSLIVYPSLAENCPFALLEAMALGRPVAASGIPPIREVCADAALYFDPHNPTEIAQTITAILRDPALARRLSLKAVSRASLFTWQKAATQTLDLFSRLARNR